MTEGSESSTLDGIGWDGWADEMNLVLTRFTTWSPHRWERLPPALEPSEWWDRDGVFSGSAGISQDGSGPYLLYTGQDDCVCVYVTVHGLPLGAPHGRMGPCALCRDRLCRDRSGPVRVDHPSFPRDGYLAAP